VLISEIEFMVDPPQSGDLSFKWGRAFFEALNAIGHYQTAASEAKHLRSSKPS
jgi:hypothetical protein